MSRPHIRLLAILRDEEAKLPALAEAVRDKIDSYCFVVDSRTKDRTASLARKLFHEVPGEIHFSKLNDETFDFAKARNENLDLARKDGVADYFMFLDADSPPVGDIPEELTDPYYIVETVDTVANARWTVPFLIRSDVPCEWRMPAHEYLNVPEDITATFWADAYILRTSEGTNPIRKAWSIDVLRREVEAGGSDAPRACFYLANVLHGSGRIKDAIAAYQQRVGMLDGNPEERFFAAYRAGELLQDSDIKGAVQAYLVAYSLRPTRVEPFFRIALLSNILGDHKMAMMFADIGGGLEPTQDAGFVERWIEEWGIYHQWAYAADKLGDKKAAANVAKQLLDCPTLPDYIRNECESWATAA